MSGVHQHFLALRVWAIRGRTAKWLAAYPDIAAQDNMRLGALSLGLFRGVVWSQKKGLVSHWNQVSRKASMPLRLLSDQAECWQDSSCIAHQNPSIFTMQFPAHFFVIFRPLSQDNVLKLPAKFQHWHRFRDAVAF